ncbi:biopolymer transporter ExbD [Bdellovibrio sp. GT3]|uniref:ExbD/TolR family protein n=1 Tax=unclassified Bdellovibrio TaxID=2633795 RepID=UPI0030F1E87A
MRRARKIKINHNTEFDLDLAPLLAVMVKLVPVLLLSSAFVQMMVIETELPQVVSEAIQRNDEKDKPTIVELEVDSKVGFTIIVNKAGKESTVSVPLKDGNLDLPALHQKLVEVKQANPEVFKIELSPDSKVAYNVIVKVMDEARQSRDSKITFPVFDTKQGKNVDTKYMFPEVVFANMMEG